MRSGCLPLPAPPPGATTTIDPRTALVIAPHFDDEVLGCGGLVAQFTAAGAPVSVLFCSDSGAGAPVVPDRLAESARRRDEARQAAAVLGLSGSEELGLPDGELTQHVEGMAEGIRRTLLRLRPQIVFVPSPLEVSADHRAVFTALHRALEALRSDPAFVSDTRLRELTILVYEVNHPLHPDVLVDVTAQVPSIERAMACYASQQEQHDYLASKLGLLKFRTLTLPPSVAAAEAYRELGVGDFTTRSPARLVVDLGGVPHLHTVDDGPLISVIVRTKDRPKFLTEALASVTRSTYRRLEVVVVNDGGGRYELPAEYPLPITSTDLPISLGRAGAANVGITNARGDFVAFLDDDDLVEPEHFEVLAGLVRGTGVRVAYTDSAVCIYAPAAGTGWQCVSRQLPFSRDFDPERLLFDNYIPFNTVLIERALLTEVGKLDPELAVFEDWDLLIRLSEHTGFQHLARVTCEYRRFPSRDHGTTERLGELRQYAATAARVLAKHGTRRTPDVTARVIDRLRTEATAEHATVAYLRWANEAFTVQADGLQRKTDALGRELDVARGELDRRREELDHRHGELGACRGELDACRGELHARQQEILAMRATRAWRLAQRWWELRRRLTGRPE